MVQKRIIPICYFPPTVIFVDDDQSYLDSIIVDLDVHRYYPKLFFSSSEAVAFLEQYKSGSLLDKCISRPEEGQLGHRSIDVNIHPIGQIIYNDKRFDETAVAVLDYAMPGKKGFENGIELAKWIRKHHPKMKILMLTAEADHLLAVKAFNEGIIDKFIRKHSENFKDILNESVCELIYQYFVDQSTIIIDSLTKDPSHPTITWLDEPKFFILLEETIKKEKAVEYYLIESYGSFLLLDDIAKVSLLIGKDKEKMQAAYEMAEDSDTPLPPDLLKEMKEYKKVIYLPKDRLAIYDCDFEPSRVLYPATELIGNKTTYYYSYVKNPDTSVIDIYPEKILSYKAYRQKQAE